MNRTDQSASASAGVACRLPRVLSDRGEPATGDEPMLAARNDLGLRIFSTCPPSARAARDEYLRQVQEIASWSEDAGCEGILVYTDNAQVDPWLVAAEIIRATRRLSPLVAIQPAYMHPYSVAKMVTSLAFLHGRRVYLNMVAGGFTNDLAALNDHTPHDERYSRLGEYTAIIQGLLASAEPFTFSGSYYQVHNLRLPPPLPPELEAARRSPVTSTPATAPSCSTSRRAPRSSRTSAGCSGSPSIGWPHERSPAAAADHGAGAGASGSGGRARRGRRPAHLRRAGCRQQPCGTHAARARLPAWGSRGAADAEVPAGDHEPHRRAEGRRRLRAARYGGTRAAAGAHARGVRLSQHPGRGVRRADPA